MKIVGALLLILVAPMVSGCESMVKSVIHPYTDHGRCISSCEEKYKRAEDTLMLVSCRKGCDDQFGWEKSRPSM